MSSAALLLVVIGGSTAGRNIAAGAPTAGPPRLVHIVVALADNATQGIVPIPAALGNGDDPARNLYWGALYGVRTFIRKQPDWRFVGTLPPPRPEILERIVFVKDRHAAYLVADAWRGRDIRAAIETFLSHAAGKSPEEITLPGSPATRLVAGGGAQLVAYVGHDGLMEFQVEAPTPATAKERDAVVLACDSAGYFSAPLATTGARPLLLTTGLMAPEAYTLVAAINAWLDGESAETIREHAAAAYDRYQKTGVKAARRLFTTGRTPNVRAPSSRD